MVISGTTVKTTLHPFVVDIKFMNDLKGHFLLHLTASIMTPKLFMIF